MEFAFVIPLFMVLVLGIVDFGMMLKDYVTVTNSAREAARLGIVACQSAADETAIKQRAVDYSSGLLSLSDVVVNDGSALCSTKPATGTALKVRANYTYEFVTPLGGILDAFSFGGLASSVSLSSATTMRIE